MKRIDIAKRAGRNLRQAKMRTLLTSVAIAIGGFAIMISLMVGEGARQYVDRVISANMDPNSIMIAKDKSSFGTGSASVDIKEYNPDSVSMYGSDYKALTADDIAALKKRSDITNVEPYFQLTPKYVEFSSVPDKKYVANIQKYTQYTIKYKTGIVLERAIKNIHTGTNSVLERMVGGR